MLNEKRAKAPRNKTFTIAGESPKLSSRQNVFNNLDNIKKTCFQEQI